MVVLLAGGILSGAARVQENSILLLVQPAVVDPGAEMPEVEVILTSGERYKGFLRERTLEKITLVIEGIATEFRAASIQRIAELGTITEQYQRARAAIDDRDTEQLLVLCSWLITKRRYDAALAELDHILAVEPGKPAALDAQRLALAHKALQERKAAPADPPEEGDDKPQRHDIPLLTPEQINILKVYEIDLGSPPRMLVERETIDRLVEKYAGHELVPASREQREALYRKRPEQIVELMFRLRARELYPEVRVLGHPRAIETFRDDVHRMWLVNSCATNRCHGGAEAGRLRLHNRRTNADATVYTNFLILDRFRLADGRPLIDYEAPADSPLLQFALPRHDSAMPHPELGPSDAWRPAFRSTDDRTFLKAVEWIMGMYRPRPEYPIEYPPAAPAPDGVPTPGPAAETPAPAGPTPGGG